jgi:hypothetical protein
MSIEALTPFFTEMRKELAQTAPDLEQWIGTMATAANDDPQLMEALENYAAQLDRIGQTAEMIGMPGLSGWCAALSGILPTVIFLEGESRLQACQHLADWPKLVDQYLEKPADFDVSMALAEYLTSPILAQPFDENTSIALIESLTSLPVVPEELMAQLVKAEAPVTVSIEDSSLTVPENADRDVFNAFIDEAPNNVEQFSMLTSKIAAGQADVEDMRAPNASRIRSKARPTS